MLDTRIKKYELGHTYNQWIVAIVVNLILFTYGLQAGWTSPASKILQSDENPYGEAISDTAMSWIASTMCITAFLSTPMYSYLVDRIGRKKTLIAIVIPQALCWIIKLISPSTPSLIIARAVCGIATGGCFSVVPLYTKEISQDSIRGALGSFVMLFKNFGILVSYAIGSYLGYYTVLWMVVGVPLVVALLLLKLPETPSYLIKIGKIEEATMTFAMLRGLRKNKNDKVMIMQEFNLLIDEDKYCKSLPKLSFRNILSDTVCRRGVMIIMMMITVQSAGGTFAVITYASTIMTESRVTVSPDLQTLSFPLVLMIGSLTSMTCIEKLGRKPLMVISLILTSIPQAVLASVILVQSWGTVVPGWVPVVAIVVSVFAHGVGALPLPYIVMSEMFNFQVRARLIGLLVMYSWLATFVQLAAFAPISNALGMHTMFYIFAALNLIGAVATIAYLPETKRKSVEEIARELGGKVIVENES